MLRIGSVGLVLSLVAACGTYKTLDQREAEHMASLQQSEINARAEQRAQQDAERQRRKDAETQQRANADQEAARLSACATELQQLQATEREESAAKKRRDQFESCPNSGLPKGTYAIPSLAETERSAFFDLEVTEKGCAAFAASDSVCTIAGVVEASGESTPKARITRGRNCGRYDLATQIVYFKTTATKGVTVSSPTTKARVLPREAATVTLASDGFPRLWTMAMAKPEGDPRIAIALAPSPPVGVTADRNGRDSCSALEEAKSRQKESAPR